MKRTSIHIDSLSIGYRNRGEVRKVVENISEDINEGELTCLLGSNGVGKSTLLRTLCAFQPKLSGKIQIGDKELEEYDDRQLSQLISVVLTEKADLRNMEVFDLVGLGRSPYTGFWGTLSREDKRIVEEAIAWVGVKHLTHRMVHTLSDGERQKVMIAKALAQETPIIYLDEPTAFLDFPSKVEMMQLLRRLSHRASKTIFLSTHDLELALQIADKIWLMDGEKGVIAGTPEDLALNGNLERFFGEREIQFDRTSGLFRVKYDFHSFISLQGEMNEVSEMIKKALARNGIKVVSGSTETFIEVTKERQIFLNHGSRRSRAESIESLLAQLEQIVRQDAE